MKKIAIIGCAGSGKTTLSIQLQKILNLPLYHLDKYYWKPNWARPDFEEFLKIHNKLCDKDQWIIDGIYTSTLFYRVNQADCIIFLDVSYRICLWHVLKRTYKYYGKVRDYSPAGCKERFDIEFLKWVWNFEKRSRPKILEILDLFKSESDQDKEKLFSQLVSKKN